MRRAGGHGGTSPARPPAEAPADPPAEAPADPPAAAPVVDPPAQAWCSAAVRVDGSVDALGAPGTACYLRASPQLLRYARAFLESAAPSARFFWQDPNGCWVQVHLGEVSPGRPGAGAVVTLAPAALPERLTPRELDILTLMAGGLSNHEIAARLTASNRTISTHVEHILGKLGQTSRAGAAAVAVDRGYLRLPLPGRGTPPPGLTVGFLHARAEGAAPPSGARAVSSPRPRVRPALRIGSAFPLRGPAGNDGQEMLNGSALAIAEINGRGGIGGRPVEQIVVDIDIFSASGVQLAFQQLFAADVGAITSGYLLAEGCMDAARELAVGYGAPYLHAMTSEAQAQIVRDNQAQHRAVFQVCPTERYYGPGFIRFLDELRETGSWQPGSRRLVFVETPLPSGQMVNRLTTQLAERSSWQITSIETVPALDADWPAVVDRIGRLDPAAIMITDFLAGELAAFQRLIVRRAPQALVYAVYAPSVPEFLKFAGPAAEGLVWATMTGTYSDLLGRHFADQYTRAFGRPPGRSHAGIAYDEVHLLAQAWMSVPDPYRFSAVAQQLRRVRYRGVNGAYYLDNPEQSGLAFPDVTPDPSLGQAHLVFQVQNGRHRIISPPPYAESSFRPSHRLRGRSAPTD
jgi:branched-chain amino acid transport system substrate-binding protein